MKIIKSAYLASPYSYQTKIPLLARVVRWWRYREITRIAAKLTEQHKVAFILPITQSHQMAKFMSTPDSGFSAWEDIDLTFVTIADELWLVMMEGWRESIGVQAELQYALSIGKPVRFVDPKTLTVKKVRVYS